jgi:hypothetical protein
VVAGAGYRSTDRRNRGWARRPLHLRRLVRVGRRLGDRAALTFGGLAAAAVAVGWFLLSSKVAHTDVQTAVSESLGAILVLMLVVSVIGSIRRG